MKGQLFNWIWWQDLTWTTSVPTPPPPLTTQLRIWKADEV
jgi:hypothetical protein